MFTIFRINLNFKQLSSDTQFSLLNIASLKKFCSWQSMNFFLMHSYCFPWSDFLSFLFWRFLSTPCTCSQYLSLSHTHTRYDSSGREIGPSLRPLTTHNIHHKETSMSPAGFEPAIPASERPQMHRTATGIGLKCFSRPKLDVLPSFYRSINAIGSSYTILPHSYIVRLYYVRLRSASVLIL